MNKIPAQPPGQSKFLCTSVGLQLKMPPKKDASTNSGNNFLVQAEEDKILQAVVIADSFNERFMPITIDKPRVCI